MKANTAGSSAVYRAHSLVHIYSDQIKVPETTIVSLQDCATCSALTKSSKTPSQEGKILAKLPAGGCITARAIRHLTESLLLFKSLKHAPLQCYTLINDFLLLCSEIPTVQLLEKIGRSAEAGASGFKCMAYGLWRMAYGVWCMVYVLRPRSHLRNAWLHRTRHSIVCAFTRMRHHTGADIRLSTFV
jgi:hypothetical protein